MAENYLNIRPVPAGYGGARVLSLGEVMLRLDPGDMRIRTADTFRAWEGGGEYNVTRALRRVFGIRADCVTALPDNDMGHAIEDKMMRGGMELRHVIWRPCDDIGISGRAGLNFTEKGHDSRNAATKYDRGHTPAMHLKPGDIDWDKVFVDGVQWFHTGGIYAALSETTYKLVREALEAANSKGIVTSYDLNYRPSLWKSKGGQSKAQEVNRDIAHHVNVMV